MSDQLTRIVAFLLASGYTLEWEYERRTCQYSGRKEVGGFWERFLTTVPPSRRQISDNEAEAFFEKTKLAGGEFLLYLTWKEHAEKLTAEELLLRAEDFLRK